MLCMGQKALIADAKSDEMGPAPPSVRSVIIAYEKEGASPILLMAGARKQHAIGYNRDATA